MVGATCAGIVAAYDQMRNAMRHVAMTCVAIDKDHDASRYLRMSGQDASPPFAMMDVATYPVAAE